MAVSVVGWSSTTTMWSLYTEALVLAQIVYSTICVHRKELELSSELQHDFSVELRNIIVLGEQLLHGSNDVDNTKSSKIAVSKYLPHLKILRKVYEDYAQFIRLSECVTALAKTPQKGGCYEQPITESLQGSDALPTFTWTTPGGLLGKYSWLWSQQKLQRLIAQSRACTSKILGWSPGVDFDRLCTYDNSSRPELDILQLDHSSATNTANASDFIDPGQLDHLSKDLFLDGCVLSPSNISALHWGKVHSQGHQETVLVEYKQCNYENDVKRSMRSRRRLFRLAAQLKAARNPSLLDFIGLVEIDRWKSHYAFCFRGPRRLPNSGTDFSSLSNMIAKRRGSRLSSDTDARLNIARWLCKTLSSIHSSEMLHRNLSTRGVVFFRHRPGKLHESLALETPFLVDFEFARPVDGHTSCNFDPDLERDVRRHPEHQGPPCESFDYEHDIYALGVVLLELGLWMPASKIITDQNGGEALGKDISPMVIQNHLIDTANEQLPACMGVSFAKTVIQCLRGGLREGQLPTKHWAREVEKSLLAVSCPGKDQVQR